MSVVCRKQALLGAGVLKPWSAYGEPKRALGMKNYGGFPGVRPEYYRLSSALVQVVSRLED